MARLQRFVPPHPTAEEFYRQWEQLLNSVDDDSKAYLNKELYTVRHRFVSLWTNKLTTFGAVSTQRVESLNANLKRLFHHGSDRPLAELFDTLLSISDTQERRRVAQLAAEEHTNHRFEGPVYRAAVHHFTRYAAEHIYTESLYVTEYFAVHFPHLPPGVSVNPSAASSVRGSYVPSTQVLRTCRALSTASGHTQQVKLTHFSSILNLHVSYLSHPPYVEGVEGRGVWLVRRRVAQSSTRTHWVVLQDDGPAMCTDCAWSNNWLLPCRHILVANNVLGRRTHLPRHAVSPAVASQRRATRRCNYGIVVIITSVSC